MKMNRDPVLEIQHKRQQSHDSGTYQDWGLDDSFGPGDFVTVVAVDEKPFVTVLSVDSSPPDSEEVLVYRLPGERLGFGLKFEGGVKSAEKVRKLLIQSCADDSPASRTRASWGPLNPGDEILVIDSIPVSEMTRMDCVRALKESNVVIKLRVRKGNDEEREAPPIPPRKFPRKKDAAVENTPSLPENSPPVLPRSRQAPQAEVYTDLIAAESILPTESESDDTGSSISTVVSRVSSTCNSSFSDAKSVGSGSSPSPESKQSAYDLDKVLEPFLQLEREFSSAALDERIFSKLVEASSLPKLPETGSSVLPKPAPRPERRRPPPPPPPPPPRSDRPLQPQPAASHLPRLIDFLPKDRTDLVLPTPLLPQTVKSLDETKPKDEPESPAMEGLPPEPQKLAMEPVDSPTPTKYQISDPSCWEGKQNSEPPPPPPSSRPPPLHQSKSSVHLKKLTTDSGKYGRNDEKSVKSVKDKIAMFSNVVQHPLPNSQVIKTTRKLSSGKIPDPETPQILDQKLLSKKESLPYQSLTDVSSDIECKNSLLKNEKAHSTIDLSVRSSKISLSKEFSTLPRKLSDSRKNETSPAPPSSSSLSRAFSFSGESKLHNRSQSMIDVASRSSVFSKNPDELRRSSLAALTEQRKKNFSKLRGLVIPEKVVEIPSLVVDDLPVIKSNDCLLENGIAPMKNDNEKLINKVSTVKVSPLIQGPLWKTENNYEIPKYSPAFKRKSLSLYGTSSSVSSVSSSLSSSREELRNCFNDQAKIANVTKSTAVISRNPYTIQSEPKSLESITSPSISDVSYDYGNESISPNLNSNELLSRFKYSEGYSSDSQRSNKVEERPSEESDNDSAVSSSRSSISPPHSPLTPSKKNEILNKNRYDLKLRRSLSSETTASNSSNGSTLTSGSQASCSSSSSNANSDNKRVLKPQSVEAINRKNVLSSARYSSGLLVDIKNGIVENEIKDNEKYPKLEDSPSKDPPVSNDSPFDSLNSSSENESCKSYSTNELIKGETSFNIDNFTYSSHKAVDKNSNVKINDYNDVPDGIVSPTSKIQKSSSHVEAPKTFEKNSDLPSPRAINVNSMKKVFEKVENGPFGNSRYKYNSTMGAQHPRVSSVDSTNSDDSCVPTNPSSHYGSASNLLREQQFGSITSLASSTSLISQQELSQLIEEANHTLEDEGTAHEVVVVILHRDIPGGSIGITLAGGADYEAKEITVHKVLMGSPAERDGRIQKGDRILSINGKSMKGLTHYESLAILKAPRPEVVLVVSRHKGETPDDGNAQRLAPSGRLNRFCDPKNVSTIKEKDLKWGQPVTVSLMKDGAGLGFSLEGGKDSPYGDQPLTIKKIFTGGCAEKSGCLFAGDELLSVNNMDVSELSRIEAWSLMKRLPDGEVHLSVRHPFS